MTTTFLYDGPADAAATILLAHGAGAAMDSAAMGGIAMALAQAVLRIARFEFGYMAARREGASRKPPPRAEALMGEYRAAAADLAVAGPLVIGGKSMGGRVASMVADELHSGRKASGLLCLGYPFHPPARPDQLRTRHLETLKTPTLICQGARDPFGTREEVFSYRLSDGIETLWLEDGDHDFKLRKSVTGLSLQDHLNTIAAAVVAWTARLSR
jgi:uncharacterized protein